MTKITRATFNEWYRNWQRSEHKFIGNAFMKEFFPEINDPEIRMQVKNVEAMNIILDRYVENIYWPSEDNILA
jgi:hypothetical protein